MLLKAVTTGIVGLLFQSTAMAGAGIEVEIDPIAYAAKGYSGHLILDTGTGVHVDFGAFGLEFPEFAEPREGFGTRFTGYGVKLNYHGQTPNGAFAGIGYGVSKFNVERSSTGAERAADIQSAGVQFGYRFGNEGFYVTPWIGFDKILNPTRLEFDGTTYDFPEINVFPTVHLGYRF